jgi:hypothetical protein
LPLLLYLPYPPRIICGYSTRHYAVACALSFLISLLAANVVTLSFLPTSLAAHTLFWEKYFRFLNGIIWSIILSLLPPVELLFINITFETSRLASRPWFRCSTTGHSLHSRTTHYHLFCGLNRNETTSILKQLALLVLFTNTTFVTTLDFRDIPLGRTAEQTNIWETQLG